MHLNIQLTATAAVTASIKGQLAKGAVLIGGPGDQCRALLLLAGSPQLLVNTKTLLILEVIRKAVQLQLIACDGFVQ